MKGTVMGFLLTAGMWAVLVVMYAMIEFARGHVPFQMLHWNLGGKFIFAVVAVVLGLGTLMGYASDRIRQRQGR